MNASVKEKLVEEFTGFLLNFLYLLLFFTVFTLYRRILMQEFGMSYGEYGISIIKALILAKVIMLGDMLRIGRRFEQSAMILHVLYTTLTFTVWVVVFRLLEISSINLLHGKGLAGIRQEILATSSYEMLAHALIIVVTFFPFFTLRELAKSLGREKVKELFLSRRDDQVGK